MVSLNQESPRLQAGECQPNLPSVMRSRPWKQN